MLHTVFYQLTPKWAEYINSIEGVDDAVSLVPLRDWDSWRACAEDSLVVTDNQACIDLLTSKWENVGVHDTEILPVIGVERGGTRLAGCSYVVESLEDLDNEFFDRVYRRVHRLPWTVIETERCIIRETTQEDLTRIYEIYENPAITAYMDKLYREREKEARYLREYQDKVYAFYGFGVWSVVEKECGLVIGRAGISMRQEYVEPELGFCIDCNFQHRGYALEVCRAILRFMREEYEVPVIQALVRPNNEASIGLLKHLGFVYDEDVILDERNYHRFLWSENA